MIIRQEQLKARYNNLFPLNETKENLDKLLKLQVSTPNKVLIESSGVNTKAIYFALLVKYIQKYNKLPSMENFTGLNLTELFFLQGSGDLAYNGLNGFKGDIITLNYSITEPVSKKAVELMCYLMHNYVEDKHRSVWVFTRPGITDLKNIAQVLGYSIVDLDKVIKSTQTKVSNKTRPRADLF